jgi:hypothetical protein
MRVVRIEENPDPAVTAEPVQLHGQIFYDNFRAVEAAAADQLQYLHRVEARRRANRS